MSIDSVAHPVTVLPWVRCRPDRRTRTHHDRLLRVEDDPDEVVGERSATPYLVGLAFAAVLLVLLVRSLRPRG